jgi:hypothetical protein
MMILNLNPHILSAYLHSPQVGATKIEVHWLVPGTAEIDPQVNRFEVEATTYTKSLQILLAISDSILYPY